MGVATKLLTLFLLVQVALVWSWDRPKYARPGQYPYQASLVWVGPPEIPHFHSCGGAILSEFWIVSSAFCITDIPNSNRIMIKAGSHNITDDDAHVQKREVEKLIVHEKYTKNSAMRSLATYDLGLLKLKDKLVFNDRVKAIKLPQADSLLSGKVELNYNLVLTGWGITAYGAKEPREDILRTVTVSIVSNKICTDSIKQDFAWVKLDDTQICTRPLDGSASGCVGDYGGPIVQYDQTNTPELVGILTWSMMPCNTIGVPPVYARIPHFVKWIRKKMDSD